MHCQAGSVENKEKHYPSDIIVKAEDIDDYPSYAHNLSSCRRDSNP